MQEKRVIAHVFHSRHLCHRAYVDFAAQTDAAKRRLGGEVITATERHLFIHNIHQLRGWDVHEVRLHEIVPIDWITQGIYPALLWAGVRRDCATKN